MKRLKRIKTILRTLYLYRLAELFAALVRPGWARTLLKMLPQSSEFENEPPAVRLRLALESLGPIFIKFGQVLSTRPDLIPHDYAVELAKLQDKVPPFDAQLSRLQIEKSLGQSIETLYAEFETEPVASASIAQVHKARLHSGEQVAVKVLRPNLLPVIEQDLSLMRFGAAWVERLFADGKRLKPREVVAEFDKYLHDELDLMREAANASQLGRNFQNSDMLIVPKVFYDYCTSDVLTIEWMDGTPVSEIAKLKADGIDLHKLADYGVEIFFTQVFRDGFFHADMHPGNILVAADNRYIALDFGIVGTLTDYDKRYLAINFLAFFNRDYHRVATAHIESGWVPADTRAEELEAAARAVGEQGGGKRLGKGFEQLVVGACGEGGDAVADGGVVQRVGDVVACPGGTGVGAEFAINNQGLLHGALMGQNADNGSHLDGMDVDDVLCVHKVTG